MAIWPSENAWVFGEIAAHSRSIVGRPSTNGSAGKHQLGAVTRKLIRRTSKADLVRILSKRHRKRGLISRSPRSKEQTGTRILHHLFYPCLGILSKILRTGEPYPVMQQKYHCYDRILQRDSLIEFQDRFPASIILARNVRVWSSPCVQERVEIRSARPS